MICYPNVKINLGLHVLRRRPDGFHDLETLFVPYPEISDCLEVIPADDYSRTPYAGHFAGRQTDDHPCPERGCGLGSA